MLDSNLLLAPGDHVYHPSSPELGLGRVQTIVNNKITINFEQKGKLIIDGSKIALDIVTA